MGRPIRKPAKLGPARLRALELILTGPLLQPYINAPHYNSAGSLQVKTATIEWLVKRDYAYYVDGAGTVGVTDEGRRALKQVARASEFDALEARREDFRRAGSMLERDRIEKEKIRRKNETWLRQMRKRHAAVAAKNNSTF